MEGKVATGKIQLEAKEDLKGRLGRSPDRADAVAMAFYSRSVRAGAYGTWSLLKRRRRWF